MKDYLIHFISLSSQLSLCMSARQGFKPTSNCLESTSFQCDAGGRIQVDGTLIDGLEVVGLTTELGSITAKDITADEIMLMSKSGDIEMNGIIDSDVITAETDADGDVIITGKVIVGENLTVSTMYGDIIVDSECRNDFVNFNTEEGAIQAQKLSNKVCNLNVEKMGEINAKANVGQLNVNVRRGSVDIFVESITTDSSILIKEGGKVNLTVPIKTPFKLWLSAPMTNIAPKLQNFGELVLSVENGNEEFSTENTSKNGQVPVLRVHVSQGSIHVNVAKENEDQFENFGIDSATESS